MNPSTLRKLLVCIIFIMIAASLPVFMFNIKNADAYLLNGQNVRLKATVTKINTEESGYASFIANVSEVNGEKADFGILVFTEFSPQIEANDIFVCDATLSPDINKIYYPEAMLMRHNIIYTTNIKADDYFEIVGEHKSLLTVLHKFGNEIGYRFDRTFTKSTSAISKALLLGDRHELPPLVERDFRWIGISHLLAISGMHLALITGFAMFILRYFILNPKIRFVIVAILSLFTIIFTGASSSILRAGLIVVYYQAGNMVRKKSDILTTLFVTTMLIVLVDPYAILDAGLILSFSAAFGIALLSPTISTLSLRFFGAPTEQSLPILLLRFIFESICISFAAGVFVTVASSLIFDEISLISIFTTLVFTPLIALLMFSAAFSLILSFCPPVSSFLISVSELISDTIVSLSSTISNFEHIVIPTSSSILKGFLIVLMSGFLICVIKNHSVTRFLIFSVITNIAFIIAVILSFYFTQNNTQVCLIALEKDNGIILSDKNHSTYIDISDATNDTNINVSIGLSKYSDPDLEVYMLTHYHFNHISTIRKLNEYTPIRKLLMPIPDNETDKEYAAELEILAQNCGIEYEYYNSLEPFEINGITVTALPLERKSKNVHPRIAFSLEKSDSRIVYNAGHDTKSTHYPLLESMLSDADILINATHGPKSDSITGDTPSDCMVLLFSDTVLKRELVFREVLMPYCVCTIAEFDETEPETADTEYSEVYTGDIISRVRLNLITASR